MRQVNPVLPLVFSNSDAFVFLNKAFVNRAANWTYTVRRLSARLLAHLTLAGVVAFLALLVFARFSAEFNKSDTLRLIDVGVLDFFRAHRGNALYVVAEAVTWLAGPKPQTIVLALSVLYFAVTRRFWPQGASMLFAGVGGLGLIVGLKALFHRPRPELVFAPLGYSFPSGHSFFALVVYGMLAYYLTRNIENRHRRDGWWAVCVFAIFLVGFSRVVVGHHYPTDVAAGFSVAYPWMWTCLSLPRLFRRATIEQSTQPHTLSGPILLSSDDIDG